MLEENHLESYELDVYLLNPIKNAFYHLNKIQL